MKKRHFLIPLLLTLIMMTSFITTQVIYASDKTPARDEIISIVDKNFSLSCRVGESPDTSLLPAQVRVSVQGREEKLMLPVEWDLSHVDFNMAGAYTLKGYFTKQGLDEHKLSNQKNLTPQITMQVYEIGPLENLRGLLLSSTAEGCTLKLVLPVLPTDKVRAVYIYRSTDNVHWTQESWNLPPGGVLHKEQNYLRLIQSEGRSSSILYRYQSNNEPIWIRVEIIGSELAGMSNSIYLETTDLPQKDIGTRSGTNTSNSIGISVGNKRGGQSKGNRGLSNDQLKNLPKEAGFSTSAGLTSGTSIDGQTDTPKSEIPKSITVALDSSDYDQEEAAPSSAVSSASNLVDSEDSAEVPAFAAEMQSDQPLQNNRGAFLTVAAIVLAVGILLLLRKLYKKNK